MSQIWNGFLGLMLNSLMFLYGLLGRNFALSIVVFTVLVRVVTLPFTLQQLRSTKASQDMQPKLAELQKKYKGDKEKLAEEQMKLYKGAGVNPLGCLVPTLIQFPIWIGLYQSIMNAAPNNPLQLLNLARHIYPQFTHLVPLNVRFLWLNLGRADPWYVMPILVVATQYLMQKMMTPAAATPEQAAQNRSMELMMPMMFGFITLQLASGLGLYFVTTNIVGMVQQYFVSGLGGLAPLLRGIGGKAQEAGSKDKGYGRKK